MRGRDSRGEAVLKQAVFDEGLPKSQKPLVKLTVAFALGGVKLGGGVVLKLNGQGVRVLVFGCRHGVTDKGNSTGASNVGFTLLELKTTSTQ